MKVVLKHDVSGTGEIDDILDVSEGFARNYLLPRKLAVPATAQELAKVETRKEAKETRRAGKITEFKALAERLEALDLTILADVGDEGKLFGSVTVQDIAASVKETGGIEIDKRNIDLSHPIKLVGEHKVNVKLYRDIHAALKVNVVARQ